MEGWGAGLSYNYRHNSCSDKYQWRNRLLVWINRHFCHNHLDLNQFQYIYDIEYQYQFQYIYEHIDIDIELNQF